MKQVDIVVVEVVAFVGDRKVKGVGNFSRMPTLAELIESYEINYRGNEDYIPGFTEAVFNVAVRGIPTIPSGFHPHVGAVFEYPDGYICVTTSHHVVLDDPAD